MGKRLTLFFGVLVGVTNKLLQSELKQQDTLKNWIFDHSNLKNTIHIYIYIYIYNIYVYISSAWSKLVGVCMCVYVCVFTLYNGNIQVKPECSI